MEEEEDLFDENDIINKEYYNGIKSMVVCLVCLNIVKDPVQCDKCQHYYCSGCIKNLEVCPLRCLKNKYSPSLACKQLLSELKIKCKCGKEIKYDFIKKHKEEECEKEDLKNNYFKLKKDYEKLKKEYEKLKKEYEQSKKEMNEIKHSYYIKSTLHLHPIEILRRFGNNWFCNICNKTFEENVPSYHCTLCDFDVCYNCVKDKVTEGRIKDRIREFY